MDGIILVDKPAGISSFGVVARVRGIIKHQAGIKVKIGHTGTLDPAATGLMILVLGKYTKRASEFSKLDKTYQTEIILGKTSSTGDSEGKIVQSSHTKPGLGQVLAVLKTFVGEAYQTPPAFSAIKVDGQRSYKLARLGRPPKLEPRAITIHSLELTSYQYPSLRLTTAVSSGTYIRSLAEDIGNKLGCGAYTSGLRRTKVGVYEVEQALGLEGLSIAKLKANLKP